MHICGGFHRKLGRKRWRQVGGFHWSGEVATVMAVSNLVGAHRYRAITRRSREKYHRFVIRDRRSITKEV